MKGRASFRAVWGLCAFLSVGTAVLCTTLPAPAEAFLPWKWRRIFSISGSPLDTVIFAILDAAARGAVLFLARGRPAAQAGRASGREDAEGDDNSTKKKGNRLLLVNSVISWITGALCCLKVIAVACLGVMWPAQGPARYPMPLPLVPAVTLLCLSGVAAHATAAAISIPKEEAPAPPSDEEQPLLGEERREAGDSGPAAPASSATATISSLLRLSAPESPVLSLGFFCGILAATGSALTPGLIGRIIATAAIERDVTGFRGAALELLAVSLGVAAFTGARGFCFTLAMARLNVRVRARVFGALLRQEIAYFDMTTTGDVTSRLTADVSVMAEGVAVNANVCVRSIATSVITLFFMYASSWRLTALTLVMVPFTLLVSKVYGEYYRKLSKMTQDRLAGANAVAQECLSTMTTVRSFAAERFAESDYADRLAQYFSIQFREAVAYSVYAASSFVLLPSLVTVATLSFGAWLVLHGHFSATKLFSFMLYQQSLSGSFQLIGDVFSGLTGAVGAAEKVFEIIHREPKVPPPGDLKPDQFKGSLALADVTLRYPARPEVLVLKGLSLHVEAGEVLALVGPSGGGKSSVVKLIQRFYIPESGRVLVDGRDVGSYDPEWLRRHVSMVGQEPVLYARSIMDNIRYGLAEGDEGFPSDEDVFKAALAANAHDFISALPDGYETQCGDKGVQLSGGQKQRIAIARALVRRPTVLLLDEATSALDTDSEAVVQEALDALMHERGHTVLVIAHRLSTVQDADRIVVIGDGRVVESGTHDVLVHRGGVYAKLVRKQLAKASTSAASLVDAAGSRGGEDGMGGLNGAGPAGSSDAESRGGEEGVGRPDGGLQGSRAEDAAEVTAEAPTSLAPAEENGRGGRKGKGKGRRKGG